MHMVSVLLAFCERDVGFWCFRCCYPEQAAELTVELRMTYNAMTLTWRYRSVIGPYLIEGLYDGR